MRPLHAYNVARVQFIKEVLKKDNIEKGKKFQPLKDLRILDVGSGGGLLAENLVRLGANVVGIDATLNSTNIAKIHALEDYEIRNS